MFAFVIIKWSKSKFKKCLLYSQDSTKKYSFFIMLGFVTSLFEKIDSNIFFISIFFE